MSHAAHFEAPVSVSKRNTFSILKHVITPCSRESRRRVAGRTSPAECIETQHFFIFGVCNCVGHASRHTTSLTVGAGLAPALAYLSAEGRLGGVDPRVFLGERCALPRALHRTVQGREGGALPYPRYTDIPVGAGPGSASLTVRLTLTAPSDSRGAALSLSKGCACPQRRGRRCYGGCLHTSHPAGAASGGRPYENLAGAGR